MTTRSASAQYEGLGKDGKGHISTQSGLLTDAQYGFNTRFEDGPGTNPEELIAAAHAGCFTMALAFALAGAGKTQGNLETKAKVTLEKDGDGFAITRSDLTLTGHVDGMERDEFERIANEAKTGCPVSKVLNCDITLDTTFG